MFHFAFIDNGHRFKTAVRVLAYTTTLSGRCKFGWPCVIKQQERADVFPHAVVGKQRANRKAITHPMGTWSGVNAKNFFHLAPPVIHGNRIGLICFVD